MSNSVQSMRIVFDFVKAARDNGKILSYEEINKLLLATVTDEKVRNRYDNFSKGYYAEELFRRVYSLLPCISLITPLGQEQYPEVSKESIQVPDYEVTFISSYNSINKVLIEVKLVDGDKETFTLLKHTYKGLSKYEKNSKYPLLFAIFWRKENLWTINTIEDFYEKSSSYKISMKCAIKNDVSAIFGDFSYMFKKRFYRKSIYSKVKGVNSEYGYVHEKYGSLVYDGISMDGIKYDALPVLACALLECSLYFEKISVKRINEYEIEIVSQKRRKICLYKLSTMILSYLHILYCYNYDDMYYSNNEIVEMSSFIIDSISQICGASVFFLIPYNRHKITNNLMNMGFGDTDIFDFYCNVERKDNIGVIYCEQGYKKVNNSN